MSTHTTHTTLPTPHSPVHKTPWRYIFAGLAASLIGIGLARFAYTPLIPPMIHANWFSAADVVYLSAANLAGYLFGALLGRPIAARITNVHTLRLMTLLVTLSFLGCAFPLSVAWFFGWRFISGVAGGAIMVLVAATLLPHIPGERKGVASGAIFLGLGLGIAGSGTLCPLLLNLGLRETWLGLGVLSAIFTAASWFAWPPAKHTAKAPDHTAAAPHATHPAAPAPRNGFILNVLYVEYALMALGLVPAMVFLVDFVARGLGAGAHLGSMFWILYGVGALFGPPLYGFLADKMGGRDALRLILLVEAIAGAFLCASNNQAFIAFLTIVIGTFPPGIPPLFLARVRELIPHSVHQQNVVWSRATIVFALFQALCGYGYSAIFNASGGDHRLLFLIAAISLGVAVLLDAGTSLVSGSKGRKRIHSA
ncbi:MAG TPA: YbfB/YjiJ family MFS transporter [Herbaspirillum sp.]|jgi:predicted MFS family arabinose efflux permease